MTTFSGRNGRLLRVEVVAAKGIGGRPDAIPVSERLAVEVAENEGMPTDSASRSESDRQEPNGSRRKSRT